MKDKDTFDPYDVKACDGWEEDKKKAEEYIYRIRWGVEHYRRLNPGIKPTVFMSGDILAVIGRVTSELQWLYPGNKLLIYGYPIKFTPGENELYVAFDLVGG